MYKTKKIVLYNVAVMAHTSHGATLQEMPTTVYLFIKSGNRQYGRYKKYMQE
jgi:hypothetical protein